MKKLLLIGIIFLTGCTNPLSSKISSEGDSTRQTITSEMAAATEQLKQELEAMQLSTNEQIIEILTLMGYYRR